VVQVPIASVTSLEESEAAETWRKRPKIQCRANSAMLERFSRYPKTRRRQPSSQLFSDFLQLLRRSSFLVVSLRPLPDVLNALCFLRTHSRKALRDFPNRRNLGWPKCFVDKWES
jgi:hypothetical protein